MVAVCKIGAFNVGRISLSYSDLITNTLFGRRREVFFNARSRVPVRAGDEIGVFHLGSTVILLFQKDTIAFSNFRLGEKIKVGDPLGAFGQMKKNRPILPKKRLKSS